MRASETGRSVVCPASLVLPRTRERPLKTEQAAEYGTLAHHWKETGEVWPDWGSEADCDLLERKIDASGIFRDDWWSGGEHEVTYALNLFTGEVQKHTGKRNTADGWKSSFDPRKWLTGTADYLVMTSSGPWIDDLKTSRWPQNPDSAQMISYHLLVWAHARRPSAWTGRSSITQWPKYKISDQPERHWNRRVVDPLRLLEHESDLRWALENPGEVNPTEEGCKFCDSQPNCPAWTINDTENT